MFAATTLAQPLVTVETVVIGDPGNAADTTGFGAVSDAFAIGKYEVTISQYATFLNAVASVTSDAYIVNLWTSGMATNTSIAGIERSGSGILGDPYSYSVVGGGNRPVTYVNWFDAARFANWLNNGATVGASTETGAYTLNGATSGIFTANPGAVWFLPTEDQWYKAAYYKGGGTNAGYWLYPVQSDSIAGNTIGMAGSANYYDGMYAKDRNSLPSNLTDAGAYGSNSAGFYGTYDQAGNVYEWNDAVISGTGRGLRGGGWDGLDEDLQSVTRIAFTPDVEFYDVGFRVATVPESSVGVLLAAGAGVLFLLKRRKSGQ